MEDNAERRRFAPPLAPGDDVGGGDTAEQGPAQEEALDGGQAEPEQGSDRQREPDRPVGAAVDRPGQAGRPDAQPEPAQPGLGQPGQPGAFDLDALDPQAEPRQLLGRDRRGLALALGPGRAGRRTSRPTRPPALCRTSFPCPRRRATPKRSVPSPRRSILTGPGSNLGAGPAVWYSGSLTLSRRSG